MKDKKTDYTIGYCNPPLNKRWASGQSGNRKGRPRGSKNTLTMLNLLANEEVPIVQNGQKIKISKKKAALLQALNKAVQGDLRALKFLLPHLIETDEKIEGKSEIINAESPKIQAMLKMMLNLFKDSLKEVKEIDTITQNQVLRILANKLVDFEEMVEKKLNSPNWAPPIQEENDSEPTGNFS